MFKVRSTAVVFIIALLLAGQAMAQLTSSNLRGQVVTADGSPVAEASVQILHVPSGTVSQATASGTGQFFQSGLRVGGPYQLTVTGDGFEPAIVEGLFLDPGSQDPIRIALDRIGEVTDRITVTGTRFMEAAELNSGVGSVFSAQDIRNQPGTDRDVINTLLRDPLAQSSGVGNLSVAGVNPRFNGLSIDGALQQDDFGLGSNTYATERSPINIDAVESVSLVASEYSVTSTGFTGGLVNIVTRSGTNEFQGNAYYAYQNDSMVGDKIGDRDFDPGDIDEKEYGFTFSGPIIEDKLFFFVSYDEYESGSPFDYINSDVQNGREPGFFDALGSLVQNTYGFDPLTPARTGNIPVTSERILTKLDWNISDAHRASFTYQSTEETGTSISSSNFESAWYDIPVDLEAYTFQLFSDWSPNLSTTLRMNYKEFARGQNCRAGGGGHFEFRLDENDVAGTALDGLLTDNVTVVAGCDRFRHANDYSDDRLQLFASADYVAGDHVFTFGMDYEQFNLFNLFVQSSNGRFIFDDVDQIINRSPSSVFYNNAVTNNANDAAAEWGYDKWAFFVGDQWSVNPDLQISAGVRYERFSQSDKPVFSQDIFDTYGVRTDNNLDGRDLFMPRLGFLYTGFDRTTISGGVGLFAGGSPQVWISNAFQTPTSDVTIRNLTNVDINTVPQEALDALASGSAGIPIDYVSDSFRIPSDWKASLRYERSFDMGALGDDYRFTAQYLYTRTNQAFNWTNLAQTDLAAALPTGVAPDGRTIYADLQDLGERNLTELGNLGEGSSHVFTLALGKVFESGFDMNVSYAYQNVSFASEGGSSRGISNWRGIFDADRNSPSARDSLYQVDHTFRIALGYERRFFGDLMTRVDAFGQINSGDKWSTAFDVTSSNSLFGRAGQFESPFDNNPLYIPNPAGDPRVVYGSGFDQAGFFAFIDDEGIPTGGIHAPFSEKASKWNNIWDLRLQQELPGIPGLGRWAKDNRFSLILDIENFLNLLNSDWGKFYNGPGFGQYAIVEADLVSAADVAANGVDGATALTGDAPRTTCNSESACLYRFNDFDGGDTNFLSVPNSVYEIRLTLRYDF
ncbi:MAG: TonB-dependent receptor [Wenzhouxiangella sp.]|nr:TonB-dependent receptor [Wenzhouxiangella sp.]